MSINGDIKMRLDIINIVKTILIEQLNLDYALEDIPEDAMLFAGGLGLDSIDALQLIVGVEAKTGIMLPQEQPAVIRSINTIVDYILSQKGVKTNKQELKKIESDDYLLAHQGDYYSIRHKAGVVLQSNNLILKISGENLVEQLNKLVTAEISNISENAIQQTLILREDGTVGAYVELYNNFDSFILISHEHNKDFIKEQIAKIAGVSLEIDDISASCTMVSISGPDALEIMETNFGSEIYGLRPLMFLNMEFNGENIVVARNSVSGEYGYIMVLPRIDVDKLIFALNSTPAGEIKICDASINKVLSTEAYTFNLDKIEDAGKSPLELNLHWAINFNKDEFMGKDALIELKSNGLKKKTRPFFAKSTEKQIEKDNTIIVNGEIVGHIDSVVYSPVLQRDIGTALINVDYAFPGVKLICNGKDYEVEIELTTAPFFVTDSYLAKAA